MIESAGTDFQLSPRALPELGPPVIAPLDVTPPVAARLRSLRSGDVATVTGLDASGIAAKRLADLGFIPGVRVEMLRSGTPCLVRVNGICLGLGAGHQESIMLSAMAST